MPEQPTATINAEGIKTWTLHNQCHREDGPAVVWPDDRTCWYLHGLCHRDNGPAYEDGDHKEWWIHGQLHREDGPAIEWDGKEDHEWYWHDVEVPQHVVEQPHTITVAEIEAEPNAEARRVMIERFGLERYVAEAQFHIIAQDDFGTLLKKRQANDEVLVVVKVTCPSTGHVHFLRVPPTTTTALEGVAWTFDMTPQEYLLAAEA